MHPIVPKRELARAFSKSVLHGEGAGAVAGCGTASQVSSGVFAAVSLSSLRRVWGVVSGCGLLGADRDAETVTRNHAPQNDGRPGSHDSPGSALHVDCDASTELSLTGCVPADPRNRTNKGRWVRGVSGREVGENAFVNPSSFGSKAPPASTGRDPRK
jgi:hypothetical protein